MRIQIKGAHEHNLQGVDVEIGDGLTVVTGVSGSGKTSLVFDTLYCPPPGFCAAIAMGRVSRMKCWQQR
jgi:ABC-type taurine transport system ATPase subunit